MGPAGSVFSFTLVVASLLAWIWFFRQGEQAHLLRKLEVPAPAGLLRRRSALLGGVLLVWLMVPSLAVELAGRPAAASVEQAAATAAAQTAMLVLFAAVWFMTASLDDERPLQDSLREDGLTAGNWPQDLRIAGRGFLLAVLPVGLLQAAVYLFELRQPDELSHSMLQLMHNDPRLSTVLLVGLVAVVFAPLVEECVFRVVLQGFLQSVVPSGLAVVLASVVFAAVHTWPNPIPLLPLALLLGVIYQRTGSAVAVVAMHGLFNLANLVLFLLTPVDG